MQQITTAAHGHILTNIGVWSPDGQRIVYDVRSDPAGERFDGTRIETVDVESGAVRRLYESGNSACCGVACANSSRLQVRNGPPEAVSTMRSMAAGSAPAID